MKITVDLLDGWTHGNISEEDFLQIFAAVLKTLLSCGATANDIEVVRVIPATALGGMNVNGSLSVEVVMSVKTEYKKSASFKVIPSSHLEDEVVNGIKGALGVYLSDLVDEKDREAASFRKSLAALKATLPRS